MTSHAYKYPEPDITLPHGQAQHPLPVITKPAHGRGIPLLELEARCTDLYQLCRREPGPCGAEWTSSPVMP